MIQVQLPTHAIFCSGFRAGCSSRNFEYIYFGESEYGTLISRTKTYRQNVANNYMTGSRKSKIDDYRKNKIAQKRTP